VQTPQHSEASAFFMVPLSWPNTLIRTNAERIATLGQDRCRPRQPGFDLARARKCQRI